MFYVRSKQYSCLATTRVRQSIVQVTCQLILGAVGIGSFGLVGGDLLGKLDAAAVLSRRTWAAHAGWFHGVTLRRLGGVVRRYRRFPLYSSWAALVNAAATWLPGILLAQLFGLHVVGWFALSQRILTTPLTLFSESVAKVYFAECAELRRGSPERLLPLFWKTVWCQAALAVCAVVLIALPAPFLFAWLFGPAWEAGGWYVVAWSFMAAAKCISYPLGATLDVLERQDLHVARELLRLIALGAVFLLAIVHQLDALATTWLLSAASGGCYLAGLVIVWYSLQLEIKGDAKPVTTGV
jgi:O-antigen/teichoic acid export membrane protein